MDSTTGGKRAVVIPRWLRQAPRYDIEEFQSPPSYDEGEFVHLRYGYSSYKKFFSSSNDDNKELESDFEIKRDDGIVETTKSVAQVSASVTFNSSGLTLLTESTPCVPTTTATTVDQLIFHLESDIKIADNNTDIQDDSELGLGSDIDIHSSRDASPARSIKGDSIGESSLLNKVKNLPVSSVDLSVFATPPTTPFVTPLSSPKLKRSMSSDCNQKKDSMVIEKKKGTAANYFFTGFWQQQNAHYTGNSQSIVPVTSKPVTTQAKPKNATNTVTTSSLEPDINNIKKGGKRHPQPHSIRELNIFAPTSL